MNPWFFMSYARTDDHAGDDGSSVQTFFEDLCQKLAGGVEEESGRKVGWLDRGLEAGVEWPAEIVSALISCRTFVCVMTARFFQRPNCGKEWAIFEKRCQDYAQAHGVKPPLILPVIWQRPIEGKFPAFVDALQDGFSMTDASTEQRQAFDVYWKKGLLRVMERLRYSNYGLLYKVLVEQLAENIVRVAREYELPPWQGPRPDFDSTVAKFPSPSPGLLSGAAKSSPGRRASFVFVAGALTEMKDLRAGADDYYGEQDDGLDWKPYRNDERAARIAMRQADELDLVPMWLKVTPDLIAVIRKAEDEASAAVVIVDPWSIELPRFDILRAFDRENFENCCCIVAWDLADPATAERREELTQRIQNLLRRRFTTNRPPYHVEVTELKQFGPTIRKSLVEINEILAMRRKPLRTISTVATRTLPSISAVQEPKP